MPKSLLKAWPGVALLVALQAFAQPSEPLIDVRVMQRDTMIGLSRKILVSNSAWREVARINDLRSPYRIAAGQVLKVPERLLRWTPVPIKIVSTSGEVLVAGAPADVGTPLSERQTVQTGTTGSAVIELADGSRMKLPPSSLAEVIASRSYASQNPGASASTGLFSGALRLLQGSIEVLATQVLRARPLEVTTPTALVGVRGTGYRVGYDEAANRGTRTEVLEGKVRMDTATGNVGADVAMGFGAALDASARPPTVVRLLPAPDLSGVPERFERPLVRFGVAGEAQALRVQVASDANFDKVVSDQRVAPGAEVRIAGLDDARWFLRARRVDALGIEGYDTVRPFVLKARPEPPPAMLPRRGAKQSTGRVELAWAQNTQARSYRVQIARDAGFNNLVVDRDAVASPALSVDIDQPGSYFWRLASVGVNEDRGPFGDALGFELRPLPQPPSGGLAPDGKSMAFEWSGRPEDRQQVELARDAEFTDVVERAELTAPQWTVPVPSRGGEYFFRYRSVEPDGFTSPYSSTLKFEVPKDWGFLWLLLPLVFGL